VDSAITKSIVVAGAPAGEQVADHRTDAQGDGHGLIRMFMHGLVSRFGAFDRLVAHATGYVFGLFHRDGETSAGFPDFFSSYLGGGVYQGARIIGERAYVITGLCVIFAHIFSRFYLFNFIHNRFSESARCAPPDGSAAFNGEIAPTFPECGPVSRWAASAKHYSRASGSQAASF
jgi:hypothetical protein